MKKISTIFIFALIVCGCASEQPKENVVHKKTDKELYEELVADATIYNNSITDFQKQGFAANFAEKTIEDNIPNKNVTASSMMPVKEKNGNYYVDGIIQSHDGSGNVWNYSAVVICYKNIRMDNIMAWDCTDIYIDGVKMKKHETKK